MVTLERLLDALQNEFLSAKVYMDSGYIWVETETETMRVSIDRKPK